MSWNVTFYEEAKKDLERLSGNQRIVVIGARADDQVYITANKKSLLFSRLFNILPHNFFDKFNNLLRVLE